jgi:inositol 3-alpha-galactosyltransferase
VEYERMVYLDAGIHVLANIDELFDLEEGHFYAAELGGPPPAARYFDAGTMFVHEPSAATAEALLHALRVARPKSFPEQVRSPIILQSFCEIRSLEKAPPCAHSAWRRLAGFISQQDFMNMFFRDQYRPIPRLDHHLVVLTMVGYTEHAQVHEARVGVCVRKSHHHLSL